MGQYLIDNNVISNFFSGFFSEKGMNFIAAIIDETPTLSVITEIEALSWINHVKNKEQIVTSFINDANVLPLTNDVVARCISIRRAKKIKIPDAIIAATAITHNLTLITSDTDFNKIPELKIIDPKSL
jgi:predicted nucleic acid-binding protein